MVLVISDGAAQPLRPGAPTALAASRTPVLDALAASGEVARVAVTPAAVPPGSEAGVPALLGHPPARAFGRGRIDAAEVVAVLRERPGFQHVVITGRDAAPELLEAADLVSEVVKVKHPMD